MLPENVKPFPREESAHFTQNLVEAWQVERPRENFFCIVWLAESPLRPFLWSCKVRSRLVVSKYVDVQRININLILRPRYSKSLFAAVVELIGIEVGQVNPAGGDIRTLQHLLSGTVLLSGRFSGQVAAKSGMHKGPIMSSSQ